MRARWLVVMALTGCNEVGFSSIDPDALPLTTVVVEERFLQQGKPATDVLFVIDDTASMSQEQAALADGFLSLTAALDREGVAWQLGVVTMHGEGEQAGLLQGEPWVITAGVEDPAAAFTRAVSVGTEGVGDEAGLAAALLALDLAEGSGPNAGFRRPGAALHVVFVSDSDDASDAYLDDPVSGFVERMEAEAELWPATASAIVGPTPDGCVSDTGSALPAERYQKVVEATGGVSTSICAAEFSGLLATLADVEVVLPARFELSERPWSADSVRVTLNGAAATGWTVDLATPAIVFDTPPPADALLEVSYLVSNL